MIAELKISAQEDFVVFQHLKNLEYHFQTRLLTERQKTMRRPMITESSEM